MTQHPARRVPPASLRQVGSALLDFAPRVLLGVQTETLMGQRPVSTVNPDFMEMKRQPQVLVMHVHSDGRLQLLELPVKMYVTHVRLASLRRVARHLAHSALLDALMKIWTLPPTARFVQTGRSQDVERQSAVHAQRGRWTATPTPRPHALTAMPADIGPLSVGASDNHLSPHLASVVLWERQTWMSTVCLYVPTVQLVHTVQLERLSAKCVPRSVRARLAGLDGHRACIRIELAHWAREAVQPSVRHHAIVFTRGTLVAPRCVCADRIG